MTDDKLKQHAQGLLAQCMAAKRLNRPPQPEYLPAGLITHYQAFLEIGHDQFGEAWTGTEVDSVSSTDVEKITARLNGVEKRKQERADAQRACEEQSRRRDEENRLRLEDLPKSNLERTPSAPPSIPILERENIMASAVAEHIKEVEGKEEAVDLVRTMLPEPDVDASKRRDAAWTKLRDWFYAGTLPVYIYPDGGGDPKLMDPKSWGRDQDYETFSSGRVSSGEWWGNHGWVIVKEDELAEALSGGMETKAPPSESVEPSGEQKQSNNEPGRPSLAPEIKLAYETIHDDGKINFDDPKNRLYDPIRKEVTRSLGVKDTPKGLGDEAIRTVITGLFDDDRTDATPSP